MKLLGLNAGFNQFDDECTFRLLAQATGSLELIVEHTNNPYQKEYVKIWSFN